MSRKRVSVTIESKTGRHQRFRDNYSQENRTRSQFVRKIKSGNYPHYHVRRINGIEMPAPNPAPIETTT